jgi:hypothetical protein
MQYSSAVQVEGGAEHLSTVYVIHSPPQDEHAMVSGTKILSDLTHNHLATSYH